MATMIKTMSDRFKGINNWQLVQNLAFRMSIAMQIEHAVKEFHLLLTRHS